MSYCSRTQLDLAVDPTLIVELTDDEGSGSTNPLIADRVAHAISNADGMVDAHLRAHYSVPLTTVPPLLRKLAINLTLAELYDRRAARLEVPKYIEDRKADAMRLLGMIRDGKMDVGVEPPPAASSAQVASYDSEDEHEAVFTNATMEGF